MKALRTIVTNTMAQMIGKVFTAGSTLLITRLIASQQGLGSQGYNDFSIITLYAAYFYILTDFDFNAIATKKMTEDDSAINSYMSNLLSMRLVIALGLIFLGAIILVFLPYSETVKLGSMLMLLTILSQAIFTNGNALFQTKLRYSRSVVASIAGSLTSLSLVYLVYLQNGGLIAYIGAMVTGSLVMGVVSLVMIRRYTPLRLSIDVQLWKGLFISALPLGITIILNLAYFKADAFILSLIHYNPQWQLAQNPQIYDVGLYNMAYRVFEVALVLPIYIVNVLYPMLVQQAQQGIAQLQHIFVRSLGLIAGLSILAAAGIWISAPLIIDFLSASNPAFTPSIQVLRWLGAIIPLFFITNILLWTIMTLGRQKSLVAIYGVAAVVNITLNIWLIPQYGFLAAVATTALAELIALTLMGWQIASIFRQSTQENGVIA